MKTKVVNLYKSTYDVYIGRPKKGQIAIWQNPYPINVSIGDTREVVIAKHKQLIISRLLSGDLPIEQLMELDGKTLGCFCAPQSCHGDTYVELIDFIHTHKIKTTADFIRCYNQEVSVMDKRGLIFGSRELPADKVSYLTARVTSLAKTSGYTTIIHGDAQGGDQLAKTVAELLDVPCRAYPAQWYVDGVYNKAAGFQRNQVLVDNCDEAIGIWDGFSKGTLDTIKKLLIQGTPLTVYHTQDADWTFDSYQLSEVAWFKTTRDEFGFLSNFDMVTKVKYGPIHAASEVVYQQFKLCNYAAYVVAATTMPVKQAKQLAYKFLEAEDQVNPNFFKHRLAYMYYVLRLKHSQHKELFKQLPSQVIVEHSDYDLFWGATLIGSKFHGFNMLGKLWYQVINEHKPLIKEVDGDLFEMTKDRACIIVHGINNKNRWGRGFVLPLAEHFPQSKIDYHAWQPYTRSLGDTCVTRISPYKYIVGIVTQEKIISNYKNDDVHTTTAPFNYDGFVKGLIEVARLAKELDLPIVMPRIGCSLGGGEWRLIKPLIDYYLTDVTVYTPLHK